MIQFISKNFKLDLSNSKLNFVAENHWFKDTLFQEFTLPSSVLLTDDLKRSIGLLNEFNSIDNNVVFNGILYRDGDAEECVLEIISIFNNVLKFNLKMKGNKLETWDSKLEALSLESFELSSGEDLYTHALSVITKVFPDVNYNFPTIWTNKFDTESATFSEFKKQLNAWDLANMDWYRNSIDANNNIIYNRNIMQPMPYLLHVLIRGFADAGKTLEGDILNDPEIKKAVIVASVDYFSTSAQQEIKVIKNYSDFDNLYQYQCQRDPSQIIAMEEFIQEELISNVGRYRIIGDVFITAGDCSPEEILIKYGNDILFSWQKNESYHFNENVHVNVTFEVSSIDIADAKKVSILVRDRTSTYTGVKIDLRINPIRYHNSGGDAAEVIYLPNEVNLKRTVPDMTFGDLIKAIMNWKNLDFEISGDIVKMNYLKNSIDRNNAVDISDLGPQFPEQLINKNHSFELKFTDSDVNPDYPYKKIYVDQTGFVIDTYEKKNDTKQILINLLPLPIKIEGNINTATTIDDDRSKLRLAFYDGLQDGNPFSIFEQDALFPENYMLHWKYWLNFRINTRIFKWEFVINSQKARKIQNNRLVFAYKNFFVPKKITKNSLTGEKYSVEIEAEKLI